MITGKKRPAINSSASKKPAKAANMGYFAWKRRIARLARWLHIYISMVSFAIVFFFAITGLTLNHADKFSNQLRSTQLKGKMDSDWVRPADTTKIDRLHIVEYLREKEGIKARLSDFRIDDTQVDVSFKGPGFSADVFISRTDGEYELTKTSAGFVGIINDLHKGRDTGTVWSWFIDIAAIFMVLVSLTGLLLLLFIKRKRISGILVASIGLLLAYLVYAIWVK